MSPRARPLQWKNNLAHDKITGRYYVRVMVHGRVVQRAFPTKRSAVMFLEQVILSKQGVNFYRPTPTLSEARDSYNRRLELLNRAPATLDYYQRRAAVLIEAFSDVQLDRIGQADVERFITERRQAGIGASTTNKDLAALRTLYKHADVERRWKLDELSAHPKRKTVHPPEMVHKIWSLVTPPVRVAVGLCLLAGLRASEAFAADASWVHGSELYVPVRKTSEWNRTWLVKTLRDLLPDDGPLVSCAAITVRRQLYAASMELGIMPPYWGPGVFRHYCASYAADAGFSPEQIRLVLAHQTGTVTDRYIRSQSIKTKRKILEAVERSVFTVSPHPAKRTDTK